MLVHFILKLRNVIRECGNHKNRIEHENSILSIILQTYCCQVAKVPALTMIKRDEVLVQISA